MSDQGRDDIEIELKEQRADDRSAGHLRILISERSYREIEAHAKEDTSRELGGVLVGEVFETDTGTALLLDDAIRALHAERQHASVRFTHETWAHINSVKDAQFPDKRIVAWYHSHPNFGIFLSDFDTFIQDNFFNLPWQVAYVVDPVRDQRGFFKWEDGKIVQAESFGVFADTLDALRAPEQAEPQPALAPPTTSSWGRASLIISTVTALLVLALLAGTFRRQPSTPTALTERVDAIDSAVQKLSGDVGETRTAVGEARGDIAKLEASVDGLTTSGEALWVKTKLYTVKRGDTLESVSRQFYGDSSKWNFIRLVNGLDRTRLREGEVLRIPWPPPWVTEGSPATEPESPPPSAEPGAD